MVFVQHGASLLSAAAVKGDHSIFAVSLLYGIAAHFSKGLMTAECILFLANSERFF